MKKGVSVVAALCALLPSLAAALSVGDIELRSKLNEQLDARVLLQSEPSSEFDDLQVRVASPTVFAAAGLMRPNILSKIDFRVVPAETGGAYIQLSTRERIREPMLNFILEIESADGGRVLREYAIVFEPR